MRTNSLQARFRGRRHHRLLLHPFLQLIRLLCRNQTVNHYSPQARCMRRPLSVQLAQLFSNPVLTNRRKPQCRSRINMDRFRHSPETPQRNQLRRWLLHPSLLKPVPMSFRQALPHSELSLLQTGSTCPLIQGTLMTKRFSDRNRTLLCMGQLPQITHSAMQRRPSPTHLRNLWLLLHLRVSRPQSNRCTLMTRQERTTTSEFRLLARELARITYMISRRRRRHHRLSG